MGTPGRAHPLSRLFFISITNNYSEYLKYVYLFL